MTQSQLHTTTPTLDQWNEVQAQTSAVTLEELEKLIADYRTKRETAEKFRQEKVKMEKEFDEAEARLISAMQLLGKTKYYVEGVGTLYFIDKLVVPTPKTVADKTKFFAWIEQNYGRTVLLEKVSVNHQTLQSMYNSAAKEHREKCLSEGKEDQAAIFSIPGIETPTEQRSVGFRKERE